MTDLIVMAKDGDTLEVHRSCVTDHQRMGWAVVPVQPAPEDDAPKARRKRAADGATNALEM